MGWFKRDLGKAGEDAACTYLRRRGYRILQRNYACPLGEIDVICYHHGCIIFVEVKTRRGDLASDPEDNITFTKRRQVERAAKAWLALHREPECAYRFDAVSVVMPKEEKPRVRHIVEAFVPGE